MTPFTANAEMVTKGLPQENENSTTKAKTVPLVPQSFLLIKNRDAVFKMIVSMDLRQYCIRNMILLWGNHGPFKIKKNWENKKNALARACLGDQSG